MPEANLTPLYLQANCNRVDMAKFNKGLTTTTTLLLLPFFLIVYLMARIQGVETVPLLCCLE
jgi:hypothetical protein